MEDPKTQQAQYLDMLNQQFGGDLAAMNNPNIHRNERRRIKKRVTAKFQQLEKQHGSPTKVVELSPTTDKQPKLSRADKNWLKRQKEKQARLDMVRPISLAGYPLGHHDSTARKMIKDNLANASEDTISEGV